MPSFELEVRCPAMNDVDSVLSGRKNCEMCWWESEKASENVIFAPYDR